MNAGKRQGGFAVTFAFHGDLSLFLKRGDRAQPVRRILGEKTSIKDAIEACGVPHTEVDLIACDGLAVDFAHQLTRGADVDVYPVRGASEVGDRAGLQRRGIRRFVADGHLGKMARNLRLLGIDAAYTPTIADKDLITFALSEERALLTRDRRLLMHAAVRDGYFPRSQEPEEQTLEVIRRFELAGAIEPYARCLRCNGDLRPVKKSEVDEQLEPLTRRYYEEFRRCLSCGRVYWSGSHLQRLQARIDRLRRAAEALPVGDRHSQGRRLE